MLRNKILQNSLLTIKPKIRHNNLPNGPSAVYLSSDRQNTFIRNLETTNFFKTSLLYKNFPNIKSNEMYMSLVSEPTCWNCKKDLKLKNFCCSSCGALQPPQENINFFELLGITQTYDLNVEDMTQKFRDLQKVFHPDKAAGKPENEKNISETYSRLLNKAFTTLKDPISRGFYLLELNSISLTANSPMDPKFLSTIMEKNEEFETVDNLTSLNKFLEENNELVKTQYGKVRQAFLNNKLNDARTNLLKLNYLLSLDKKIKEKESKLKPK